MQVPSLQLRFLSMLMNSVANRLYVREENKDQESSWKLVSVQEVESLAMCMFVLNRKNESSLVASKVASKKKRQLAGEARMTELRLRY